MLFLWRNPPGDPKVQDRLLIEPLPLSPVFREQLRKYVFQVLEHVSKKKSRFLARFFGYGYKKCKSRPFAFPKNDSYPAKVFFFTQLDCSVVGYCYFLQFIYFSAILNKLLINKVIILVSIIKNELIQVWRPTSEYRKSRTNRRLPESVMTMKHCNAFLLVK